MLWVSFVHHVVSAKLTIVVFSASRDASLMLIIINLGLSLVVIPVLTSHSLAISSIGRQSVTPPEINEKLNM
jgi:hypothetical protein